MKDYMWHESKCAEALYEQDCDCGVQEVLQELREQHLREAAMLLESYIGDDYRNAQAVIRRAI